MNIKQVLHKATDKLNQNKIPSADLDAEVLLEYILKQHGFDRAKILAYGETEISIQDQNEYFKLIKRRIQKEPVAYIIKEKEFFGIPFYIDERVLIPRPETEILVEKALETIKEKTVVQDKVKIIDVGTGSGCIAITLQKTIQEKLAPAKAWGSQIKDKIEIHASDVSLEALAVMEINLKKYNLQDQIKLHQSDLLEDIEGKFDLICANLPYLSKKDYSAVNQEVKNYEPKQSLKGGDEGVELYLKLFDQIPEHINKKAQVLIEIHPYQKEVLVREARKRFGNLENHAIKDLSQKERFLEIAF